jgi:hypothetical protein
MKTFLIGTGALLLAGCGMCGNTVKNSAASPDGKYVATAFIRDCGATTDYSPQVYIGRPGKAVSGKGNVFVGDHSSDIQVKWTSSTNLMIYSDCIVIRHVTNYEGITITFQKQAPQATGNK